MFMSMYCTCTLLFLTLWKFCTSNSSHDPKGERRGREREREGGRRRKREGEGGRGRVEKGIKTVRVSLTFWNDFILTVS